MNGEAGPAVALLRTNIDAHRGIDPPAVLRLDPVWDPIRKDPGFATLAAGREK
jgi:hypothetical protein